MFVDARTRFKRLFVIQKKSDAVKAFHNFFTWAAECSVKVHVLRSDRGGEFTSHELGALLQAQQVQHYQVGG
jgi:hypothetical protein